MNTKTLVDEHVLDTIPNELIRPLLAISIRAAHLKTIEDYKVLLKDIRHLTRVCSEAGGESLYYIHVKNVVEQRLAVLLAAQKRIQTVHPQAELGTIDVSRWRVDYYSDATYGVVFVGYQRAGIDRHRMEEKIRLVVTDANEEDL